LIDDRWIIDAGTGSADLSLKQHVAIDRVFLTLTMHLLERGSSPFGLSKDSCSSITIAAEVTRVANWRPVFLLV
jgi:hypothetical protein